MPIRHGGRLASRASTWPRDHFCRSTRAPPRSWPTRWNEFLPISMPMMATSLLCFWDMACSVVFGAPRQLGPLAGLEHGRTIPLAGEFLATTARFVALAVAIGILLFPLLAAWLRPPDQIRSLCA